MKKYNLSHSIWLLTLTFFMSAMSFIIQPVQAIPQLTMPKDKWLVNTWKNAASADISFEKAPDDSSAVRIKYDLKNGNKIANAILPSDLVQETAKTWPTKFNGFQSYIWNDGETRTIRIVFIEKKNVKGKEESYQFNSLIKVDHKGWKLIMQTEAIDFQHRQAKLNPSQIVSAYVNVDRPAEIAIGALIWAPDAKELRQLDERNSAAIYKISAPPKIDGRGDDKVWENATNFTFSHVLNSSENPKNQTTAKVLFDNDNLYLFVYAPFTNRNNLKIVGDEDDASIWDGEDIEVILYPGIDSRKYAHFAINPKGVKTDLSQLFDQVDDGIVRKFKDWNPQWEGATYVEKDAWTAEISIPWKSIENSEQPPIMQLQIGRNDSDAGQFTLWQQSPRKPDSTFGIVTLNDKAGGSVNVPSINFWQGADKKYFFRATILADQDLGGLTVKTYFNPPRTDPEVYTKVFKTTGRSANIEFPIDSDKLLNGEYLAAVEFIPNNKSLSTKGLAYFFNQYQPSKTDFLDVIFNPQPKELIWNSGIFMPVKNDVISVTGNSTDRTVKTAEYLTQKINGIYGFTPKIERRSKGRIQLSIDPAAVKKEADSDSEEAYTLEVTPDKISIVGASERGLYYGVVTLNQLMTGLKSPNAPMRTLNIVDWPSYPTRVVMTYEQFHDKKYNGHNTGFQLDRYKKWLEDMVAGQKYNMVVLTWGDQINYPSVPEVHHKDNFNPEEVSELFEFAREHFIDAAPGVLFGAHSVSWGRHFPNLVEPGWHKNYQLDVTEPGTYDLMERIFGDLIDIAGPEAHYFVNQNDEWWAGGAKTMNNYVYKGKTRQDLLYEYLTKAHDFLDSKGKQMVMVTDMIHPKHNGAPPWNLSDIAKKLPRNIVLSTWSESNDIFTEMGFKNTWTVNNGFKGDSRRPNPADSGYGQIYYPGADSLFNQTDQDRTLGFSYLTTLTAANYAWNKETKPVLPANDWALEKMPAYLGSLSFKPNPAAGDTLTMLTVPQTAKIEQWSKIASMKSAGDIRIKPGAAIAKPESSVNISVDPGTKASSFYVLGAVYPKDRGAIKKLQQAYKNDKRARPYGLIVGQYRINYTDGTSSEYNARLGRSISLFQYTPAPSRYGQELRAVVPLSDDQETALVQFGMVNPYPGKVIKSFEVTGNYDYAPILVSGITMRSVR